MLERPLNLQLVIDILTYPSKHGRTVTELDLNPSRDEKDQMNIERHFEVLRDFKIVELYGVRKIKSLTSTGNELADIFKNKEALNEVISRFGKEIDANQLNTILDVGSKIIGHSIKPDPEKKALEGGNKSETKKRKAVSLTIRQAKQRLIDFVKSQIPKHVSHIIKVPSTAGSTQILLQNRTEQGVKEAMFSGFGEQKTVNTRIDRNTDIPGIKTLELYEFGAENEDLLSGHVDNEAIEVFMDRQERRLGDNLQLALTHDKSRIALLIRKHKESELDSEVSTETQNISSDEPKKQNTQQEANEPPEEITPDLPPTPPETIANPLQLAHLNSDAAHKGKDLLGFKYDVEAFAAIMALEKLTPPLAIALFGQWGTGKSFFMQKLSEKVEELAKYQGFLKNKEEEGSDTESGSPEEKPFCEGICQIQFNAWSYMDTNLWASLVTRIFEGLDDYINDDKPTEAQKEKDIIKSGIAEQLDVAKGQLAELEASKAQVQDAIDTLKDQVSMAQKELNQKIEAIQKSSQRKVIKEAIEGSGVEQSLRDVLDKAGITQDKLNQVNPDLILKELKSVQTFAHQFLKFSSKDWLWVAGGVLLLVVPALITELNGTSILLGLEKLGAALTLAVGLLAKVRGTAGKLSPLVNGVLKIKHDYDTAVEEAVSKHKQDILAKQIEAEQKEVELNQLNTQLKAKEAEIKGLDYSTESVLAQKAMYNFITRKAGSNDYSKHLGIISMIRKDFQTLSELFVESAEAGKVPEKDREKYQEFDKIRKAFDKPLQRIILYIDDLDRCPEERVVEVLEAVNLLMAFPLFVVVVGVDPRWVKNALIKKYHLQFTGHMKGSNKEVDSLGMEVINPSDYLEKIFQIPFHLKAPEDESIKNMITHLLGDAVVQKPTEPEAEEVDADGLPDLDLNAFFADKSLELEPVEEEEKKIDRSVDFDDFDMGVPATAAAEEEEEPEEAVDEDSEDDIPKGLTVVTPASLILHWEEGEYMRNLSWLIGNTPRTVKRFVNMYRIIRAHEGLSYEDDRDKKSLMIIMFILTVRTGPFNDVSTDLLNVIGNLLSELTVEELVQVELENYRLKHIEEVDKENLKDSEEWHRKLDQKQSNFRLTKYGFILNEITVNNSLKLLRSARGPEVSKYVDFVKRFSFKIPE